MNPRFLAALVSTAVVLAVAIALGAMTTADRWTDLAQAAGTIGALIWLVFTGLYQADQFQATERATNRQVALQGFQLVRDDLEDLMKAIETEMDKLGQRTADYATRFANGERTAYVKPLTANNGARLRGIVSSPTSRPQLRRLLSTYVATFEPVLALAGRDAGLSTILEGAAHGRVYFAIKAALAADDAKAKVWFDKLAKANTAGDGDDDALAGSAFTRL